MLCDDVLCARQQMRKTFIKSSVETPDVNSYTYVTLPDHCLSFYFITNLVTKKFPCVHKLSKNIKYLLKVKKKRNISTFLILVIHIKAKKYMTL